MRFPPMRKTPSPAIPILLDRDDPETPQEHRHLFLGFLYSTNVAQLSSRSNKQAGMLPVPGNCSEGISIHNTSYRRRVTLPISLWSVFVICLSSLSTIMGGGGPPPFQTLWTTQSHRRQDTSAKLGTDLVPTTLERSPGRYGQVLVNTTTSNGQVLLHLVWSKTSILPTSCSSKESGLDLLQGCPLVVHHCLHAYIVNHAL